MKNRGKRLSKKTKGLPSIQTKRSPQDQVVSSKENILSSVNDDIVNLPPPLTTTIDEIEGEEDSISVNGINLFMYCFLFLNFYLFQTI